MIAIIDYNAGNIRSVANALHRLGAEYTLTSDAGVIQRASHLLLPGVGHAGAAANSLRERGLDSVLKSVRRPVLGICVGMQVMCRHLEEGSVDGLNIFDVDVVRFRPLPSAQKVPHTGWDTISNLESKLMSGVPEGSFVYYVHSYYAPLCCDTIATTRYGVMYSGALKYENFYGTQFHPEKSGDIGEQILSNFLSL